MYLAEHFSLENNYKDKHDDQIRIIITAIGNFMAQ